MNVGFIGTGNIANVVAKTLNKLDNKDIVLYACASRSTQKAEKFAKKHGFKTHYGSYDDLIFCKNVDLVYIATPHSTHYHLSKRAIEACKNVIVEKPASTDAKKLGELIALAKEKNVFFTEAFWTAFDPIVKELKERSDKGEFGEIISVESSFCQPIAHIKRLFDPSLAGGALLDLGVYDVFHSLYYTESETENIEAHTKMLKTKVDGTTKVSISFNDHFAKFVCSIRRFGKNNVTIDAEKAKITLDIINFPTKCVIKHKGSDKREILRQKKITGYEFEFIAIENYLKKGEKQAKEIPHDLSLKIISCCDEIRKQIGLTYPFD